MRTYMLTKLTQRNLISNIVLSRRGEVSITKCLTYSRIAASSTMFNAVTLNTSEVIDHLNSQN